MVLIGSFCLHSEQNSCDETNEHFELSFIGDSFIKICIFHLLCITLTRRVWFWSAMTKQLTVSVCTSAFADLAEHVLLSSDDNHMIQLSLYLLILCS